MRFSVIVPVKNGMPYLVFAVRSVLRSNAGDFELIVSVEDRDEDAVEFLGQIDDSRLRIIHPPPGLSMSEHWDWAQESATGDWQMFLGQDDGVQDYFFELAGIMAGLADSRGIRTVASSRAYIHWPGASSHPNPLGQIERVVVERIEERSLLKDARRALFGTMSYNQLPQMYTTSLFAKSLLDEVRFLQGGRLITTHPQDACLAANAVSREHTYLKSMVPLGWVGTSPKSAGASISAPWTQRATSAEQDSLAQSYLSSVDQSPNEYPHWAGDFSLGISRIYFWQAVRRAARLRAGNQGSTFRGSLATSRVLAAASHDCGRFLRSRRRTARKEVLRIARQNNVAVLLVQMSRSIVVPWFIHRTTLLVKRSVKKLLSGRHLAHGPTVIQTAAGDPLSAPYFEGRVPSQFDFRLNRNNPTFYPNGVSG